MLYASHRTMSLRVESPKNRHASTLVAHSNHLTQHLYYPRTGHSRPTHICPRDLMPCSEYNRKKSHEEMQPIKWYTCCVCHPQSASRCGVSLEPPELHWSTPMAGCRGYSNGQPKRSIACGNGHVIVARSRSSCTLWELPVRGFPAPNSDG